jgi:hypothetical protein
MSVNTDGTSRAAQEEFDNSAKVHGSTHVTYLRTKKSNMVSPTLEAQKLLTHTNTIIDLVSLMFGRTRFANHALEACKTTSTSR